MTMSPRRFFVVLLLTATLPVAAQDVLTIGTTSASAGSTVAVPVYLRDVTGTPLGTDAGSGNRIQSLSIQVSFPAVAVTSATFARAGALAGLSPSFEQTVNGNGTIGWLGQFVESTQPIPLTANAPLPGNRIGTLTLTLASGLANGSTIALTFSPENTLLSNQGGTLSETTLNNGLNLTNASITIGGATTTTAIGTAPNPSGIGQAVTLTAWVSSAVPGTITGFASFYDGSQFLGYSALQDGQAMLTTPFVSLGGHNITATYEGDAAYQPSTSASLLQSVSMFATPTNVVATGTSSTTATITWTPIAEATSYEVRRKVNGSSYALAGSPATASFNDGALTPNSEYLYEVRAVYGGSGSSADSAPDVASTFTFSDDPLVAGTTLVKAIHLTQLRTAVNALRSTAGLLPATFTDPSLGIGSGIRKVHIDELRAAIVAARTTLGLSTLSFADPTLTAQSTLVKALHIQQLRTALK
ncbi:MAG TPA: Ig-like domain repeat protein [Thermoanaerobaculia bacterium]|nr:Ig-like domain repeat protein [Thermoanaerobaculia bacterium]